jgi:hypothetical protein
MRSGIAISLVLCSFTLLVAQSDHPDAASAARLRATQSFMDTISLVPEKQDSLTKEAVAKLAGSAVPTANDAASLAFSALVSGPGLSAQDGWTVTGLFGLGSPLAGFGAQGDLVWEVRVHRGPARVIRVLWVSTTTKAVRALVPSPLR